MSKSDLRIDVLGTEITISADEDPEYLKALLEKYRGTIDNVKRITGFKDPLKIAILSGFLLCDDLQKAGSSGAAKNTENGEAEQLTLGMISRLEELVSDAAGTNIEEASASSHPTEEAEAAAAPHPKYQSAIYKLENIIKNYDWGSPEWLPSLMKQRNISRVPWAELWMGVNAQGPSRIIPCGETESDGAECEKPLLS